MIPVYDDQKPGTNRRLEMPVEVAFAEVSKKDLPVGRKYLVFSVDSKDEEDVDVIMPPIKYYFK